MRLYIWLSVSALALALVLMLVRPAASLGPGLGIVVGPGLQGTGSAGNPFDVKAGTSNGQLVAWNGTAQTINDYCDNPSLRYCFKEEFEMFTSACTTGKFAGNAGAGASCTSTANLSGHPGVASMQTGTGAAIGVRWSWGSNTVIIGDGSGSYCTKSLVMLQNLSNTTIEYFFKIGFAEPTSAAESVDAIEAVYDRPNTGDKWGLKTCSNSACTTTVCNGAGGTVDKPVVAGQWYMLENCANAAGTSTTLAVNGQVCATNTTNIPTGTSRQTSVGAQCFNNSGSAPANQICYVDGTWVTLPFGVAR